MQLQLTPEQEAHLARIARHEGKAPEQLATEKILSLLEDDEDFHIAVRLGLAQADAGDFIDQEEMQLRFEKMMHH